MRTHLPEHFLSLKKFSPRKTVFWVMLIFLLGGCSLPEASANPDGVEKAQVIFTATSLRPLAPDETVNLVILDEVTGLPYNETHISMTVGNDGRLLANYVAPIGTVVTYRYEKIAASGATIPEVTVSGTEVQIRRYVVTEPAQFIDTIAGWEDNLPDSTAVGTITGKVMTSDLGVPVADILVSAGGLQTITDGEGNFTLYPVSEGTHNLVALSMNGSYLPFQHSVAVSSGKITPVEAPLTATAWREVTFSVEVPDSTIEGAPIRLAGNLSQLGNTFIDLGGGMSGDTKEMPQLVEGKNGNFTLTLTLPVGIDIRYKYTMGDGFWNSEHGMDNTFVVHQLILPDQQENTEIDDQVYSWKTSETETIWFRVAVPEDTPQDEAISLQFFLGTWMPSLPMFKINENTWAFPLISPHNFSGELPYRYCRNTPCTGEIQAGIEQIESPRQTLTRFEEVYLINDTISNWAFLANNENILETTYTSLPKEDGFIVGLSLTPYYTPTERSYNDTLFSAGEKPYNHVVISPAWEAQSPTGSLLFTPTLENTIRWQELTAEIQVAHTNGLTVSLFPLINFSTDPLDWWGSFPAENEASWQNWLDQYRQIVYEYAQLAQEAGVETLVLGGAWLTPALPVEDNAATYNLPGNIESLWEETIAGVQERFSGEIAWQLTQTVAQDPPAFLSDVDSLYLQWNLPAETYNSINELNEQIGENLDEIAEPLKTDLDKPLILILAYPSIVDYNDSCISSPNDEGGCINTAALLLEPSVENPASADLTAQEEYYQAFLAAVDQRDWVDGVLSQGYYSVNQIHDTSASIHGKPAETIFENWATQVLGK
ncbi:hypothetical protein KQH54_01400 [bacterium]|nr:hypothetical protein [bacterium]